MRATRSSPGSRHTMPCHLGLFFGRPIPLKCPYAGAARESRPTGFEPVSRLVLRRAFPLRYGPRVCPDMSGPCHRASGTPCELRVRRAQPVSITQDVVPRENPIRVGAASSAYSDHGPYLHHVRLKVPGKSRCREFSGNLQPCRCEQQELHLRHLLLGCSAV